jgi:hypothetical protein
MEVKSTRHYSVFTKSQRRDLYAAAASLIAAGEADFGCVALLMAGLDAAEDFRCEDFRCHTVDPANFPEFFLFKEDNALGGEAWLGPKLDPGSSAERRLRYDVLCLCAEMCKD